MLTLYENIVRLCKQRGVKPSRMCDEAGISKSIMSRLKKNESSSISIDVAQKMADYLGVTVNEILNGTRQGNLIVNYQGYKMGRNEERERWESRLRDGSLKEESPGTPLSDEALMFALFGNSDVIMAEDLQAVKSYAAFLKNKRESE